MNAASLSVPPRRWGWRAPSADATVSPRAAVAHGATSRRLLGVLASAPPSRRERWRLTAAQDWLIVLGDTAALPWVDGIRYAAPATGAPMLWLPTHAALDVEAGLVLRALQRRHPRSPLLLWPAPELVLPLDRAQPASDDTLSLIAKRWQIRLSIAVELAGGDASPPAPPPTSSASTSTQRSGATDGGASS